MTLPGSAHLPAAGARGLTASAGAVGLGGLLGLLAAVEIARGSLIAALFLIPYLALVWLVWWLTRGNVVVTLLLTYFIAPVPADNLLPQVTIFAATDYAIRPRDLFYFADLLLVAALVMIRPQLPRNRLERAWLAALLLLAIYPAVIGIVNGVGQSVPAVLQGVVMPLRGVGVVILVAWWARTRGWASTLRDAGRTLVLCGALLAIVEVMLLLWAAGANNFSLFGYPLVTDGRPALPGWGNNILANFLCICLVTLVFLRRRLAWGTWQFTALAVVLFFGLVCTDVRIATLLAVAVLEIPLVLALMRRVWARRGAMIAIPVGAVVGVVLAAVTLFTLAMVNPRFTTLVPPFMRPYVAVVFPNDTGLTTFNFADPSGETDLGARSIASRHELILSALNIWGHRPLIGAGWNGWGWTKQHADPPQVTAVDPHNGLTWLLVDTGLLGLLLLYLIPVMQALRRWDLWWLWAIPACATALEMVNPNLSQGHFAVLVWAFLALGFVAARPSVNPGLRQSLANGWRWLRGVDLVRPSVQVPDSVPVLTPVKVDVKVDGVVA